MLMLDSSLPKERNTMLTTAISLLGIVTTSLSVLLLVESFLRIPLMKVLRASSKAQVRFICRQEI